MQDDLIEEKQSGFVLNSDWDGEVYFLFDNGVEIAVAGSIMYL